MLYAPPRGRVSRVAVSLRPCTYAIVEYPQTARHRRDCAPYCSAFCTIHVPAAHRRSQGPYTGHLAIGYTTEETPHRSF